MKQEHVTDAIAWHASEADHPARRAYRASMAAVIEGRKDDWLALFAPDALIEDPVGPSFLDPSGNGHRGRDGITAFWDNFISTIAYSASPSPTPSPTATAAPTSPRSPPRWATARP